MARENEIANVYICAIWLTKARRRDDESIRFWSQILGCQFSKLKQLMKECEILENPKFFKRLNRQATNPLMIIIYEEIKDFTTSECKSLLKRSRGK